LRAHVASGYPVYMNRSCPESQEEEPVPWTLND
jgi:hypothetical protein